MSETGMSIDQQQDSTIWHGLGSFSRLPDWLVAARDPDVICDRLSHIVPSGMKQWACSAKRSVVLNGVPFHRYRPHWWLKPGKVWRPCLPHHNPKAMARFHE